ncbi:exodeoxyribonuclease V alpha subunit [Spiroplasma helicoides]|uniref:Exodeoxyribonuclease V alpha subunit n=1 Tax=Spiroplasma helicoides TaxID=216938 RepID=A0A1B3SKW6_9MOLU|nr:AAA family ATPase [Spiroplasma helicoides]AOG60560.1 exodeoxyribonuclease V alpha subunit [Spiroplasma helicoides]
MIKVKGKIKNYIYNNDAYGVAVFNLIDNDKRSLIITGDISIMKIGVVYELEGEIVTDKKRNQTSFVVSTIEQVKKFNKDFYIKYISSSLFPTIGKDLAKSIVDFYETNIFEKILNNKKSLLDVPDMTEEKAMIIYDVIRENFQDDDILNTFKNYGLKLEFYNRMQKDFIDKNELKDVLKNSFYEYAYMNNYSPFLEVDKVALAFGVDESSEMRVSWIAYNIGNELLRKSGNTSFTLDELRKNIKNYLLIQNEDIDKKLQYAKKNKILYFENKRVYTKESYENENNIANKLFDIEKNNVELREIDFEKCLVEVEKFVGSKIGAENFTYNIEQRLALKNFYENNVSIITGGPGTGKTTLIMGIIKFYEIIYNDSNYAIVAPTGRAASRIRDQSGYHSSTIHRLLKYIGNNNFEYNSERQLNKTLLIVDESSMIDSKLFSSLLDGVSGIEKFVLVGDVQQLPSVDYGNVFEDLIESCKFSITNLSVNNRQITNSEKNSIVDIATAIKNKKIQEFDFDDTNNVETFFIDDTNQALKKIIEIYTINRPSNLDEEINKIQIIAPMYKEDLGISILNNKIQNIINTNKVEYKRGNTIFRIKDKIMFTENDPIMMLSNGDVGYISDILFDNKKFKKVITNFNDQVKEIATNQISKIELNYACSIHKTQGSEYDLVILVLDSSNKMSNIFLNNKMLYTAVTRAKKKLFIVSSKTTFIKACLNDPIKRFTTLQERIKNIFDEI